LIESSNTNVSKITIREEQLSEWIVSQQILSLAVEGNIDQSQYCEKIKSIVEFIGDRIKNEEISALWNMQVSGSIFFIIKTRSELMIMMKIFFF
jgi:ubiquitin carboxyl-terminal hydrolase 9/24